ncbi:hypothetical protein K435DRAFT_811564 [Dendrothele bispora CBS 962.96]|uniref:Uncharacterized protein n=1 Tax=Dendrothele bispora (strain CBS 962.96) TaxID=1314807 RepID=A0A4S8KS25_DENBC|nr:hypothetical protein K435DRAFT_811564 [Dendrothele bispora CBS 962.96]
MPFNETVLFISIPVIQATMSSALHLGVVSHKTNKSGRDSDSEDLQNNVKLRNGFETSSVASTDSQRDNNRYLKEVEGMGDSDKYLKEVEGTRDSRREEKRTEQRELEVQLQLVEQSFIRRNFHTLTAGHMGT